MQPKTLALFDFDGTLTKGDSLSRFLWFAVPLPKLFVGAILVGFRFLRLAWSGAWTNEKAKEILLATFFKGFPREALYELGEAFCQQKLPAMLRPERMGQLEAYKVAGATVVLVSASPDIWLRPFCAIAGIQLICTELAFESGIFTGKLATPNCNGHEKARRVRAAFDLNDFDEIVAFGNSMGDAEMLALQVAPRSGSPDKRL